MSSLPTPKEISLLPEHVKAREALRVGDTVAIWEPDYMVKTAKVTSFTTVNDRKVADTDFGKGPNPSPFDFYIDDGTLVHPHWSLIFFSAANGTAAKLEEHDMRKALASMPPGMLNMVREEVAAKDTRSKRYARARLIAKELGVSFEEPADPEKEGPVAINDVYFTEEGFDTLFTSPL